MTFRPLSPLAAGVLLTIVTHAALAQNVPLTPTPALAEPASAAKKELVQRLLKLQQPGIERMATAMTEEPAVVLANEAANLIGTRVPKDRQDAVAKDIQGEVQKYLKDTVPQVRKSAQQLAPTTIGTVLESKFSEDELRQVVGILESPAYAKYQQLTGEMQQTLQAKLVAETRATVMPRVQALEKAIGDKLQAATQAAAAPAAPAPPAPKAATGKPAAK